MMRALLCLVVGLMGLPVVAQTDNACYQLGPNTVFCGKNQGWKPLDAQPVPGTTSFQNRAFLFAVSNQAAHGQSVTPHLYDLVIEGILSEMGRRVDAPAGTHRIETIDVIRKGNIQGRRVLVFSDDGEVARSYMLDVYQSNANAWTTQTAHADPIPPARLAKVHALVIEELTLDP